MISSADGTISYQEWCERERERIINNGGSARIVKRSDGWIALFR